MTGLLRRVVLSIIAALACTLLLAAALAVGAANRATLVGVRFNAGVSRVHFGVVDTEREMLVQRVVRLPSPVDSVYVESSGTVRASYPVADDWALADFDVRTGAFSPVIRVPSQPRGAFPADLVALENPDPDDPRRLVYARRTGDLWAALSPDRPPERIGGVAPFLADVVWLDDGRRGLALSIDQIVLFSLDGGEPAVLETGGARYWLSPDRAFIMLHEVANGISSVRVFDTGTLRLASRFDGYSPEWCAGGVHTLGFGADGQFVSRLVDPATGASEAVPLPLSFVEVADFLIQQADPACDWFVFRAGSTGESWLIHRRSGAAIPAGVRARVLAIDGDTVTYQAIAGDMLELRRVGLDGGAPELLEQHPRLGAGLTHTRGWWRGVYRRGGVLLLVDMQRGTETVLASDVVEFSVLP